MLSYGDLKAGTQPWDDFESCFKVDVLDACEESKWNV